MIVATLEIELRMDGCFSLKEKRHVLRGTLEKLRRDLQISAAEVDDHDLWNSAVVGLALATNDAHHAEGVLDRAVAILESHPEIEVVAVNRRVERT